MKTKTAAFSSVIIGIQSWLRPALTPVCMNCDFERFRSDLEKMDHDLRASSVESLAVELALEGLGPGASERQRRKRMEFAPTALRMELLRHLLGLPSFRSFSKSLAGSDLPGGEHPFSGGLGVVVRRVQSTIEGRDSDSPARFKTPRAQLARGTGAADEPAVH